MANAAIRLDQDMQVGLRAAAQILEKDDGSRAEMNECLSLVMKALDKLEALLEESLDDQIAKVLEADFVWKTALLESITPTVSADQLRAIFVLVKARPYLSDLPNSIS